MYVLAEWTDILLGGSAIGGSAGIVSVVLFYLVKFYKDSKVENRTDAREEHNIRMEAEESALRHYRDIVRLQDTRIGRMEKKMDEINQNERRCWRKYNAVIARLMRHEEIMREAGLQFEAFVEGEGEDG